MNNKSVHIEIKFLANNALNVDVRSVGFKFTESPSTHFISSSANDGEVLTPQEGDNKLFSKKMKGVLVKRDTAAVKITNDPFCTIPLYYFQRDNKVIVTSEPYLFCSSSEAEVDQAGLWEIILFGSCLSKRTLFKGLNQFPSASELTITKGNVAIERYWDFNVEEDSRLNNEKTLVEALDSQLVDIFSALPEKQYLMGISGGLDSRLTAAYLDKTQKAEFVNTFTYCSTKQSLDYQLAKSVSQHYGLQQPQLCLLNEDSYRSMLDFLPRYTCGQIGIQHAHICSVLSRYYKNKPWTQLSNYYSDALFGYECSGVKQSNNNDNSLIRTLNSASGLNATTKAEIAADISDIFSSFNSDANYSSLDEYKYITERNQKFHLNLAFQQARYMDTELPYADYGLLTFMLSVPVHLRKRKKVLDLLFTSGLIKNVNVGDISSRHFIAGNQFSNQGIQSYIRKFDFKMQNIISAAVAKATQGKIIYPNKYHTEAHVNMLHLFSGELNQACDELKAKGFFTQGVANEFSTVPVKSAGVSERFQIVSLNNII